MFNENHYTVLLTNGDVVSIIATSKSNAEAIANEYYEDDGAIVIWE
jgi:hypothetical protein